MKKLKNRKTISKLLVFMMIFTVLSGFNFEKVHASGINKVYGWGVLASGNSSSPINIEEIDDVKYFLNAGCNIIVKSDGTVYIVGVEILKVEQDWGYLQEQQLFLQK